MRWGIANIFLSLLLLPIVSHADTAPWRISPGSCLKEQSRCDADIKVSWELPEAKAFCVARLPDNDVLICVDAAQQGAVVLPLKVEQTTEFAVIDAVTQNQLTTLTIRVLTQASMKRKRKRHAWSVI